MVKIQSERFYKFMRKLRQFELHIKIAFYSPNSFYKNLKDFFQKFQLKTKKITVALKTNSFKNINCSFF